MPARAFGCEASFEKSPLILIPVPWSAGASYGLGAEKAPRLIRKASEQLDFFSPLFKCEYNDKIYFLKEDALISSLNRQTLSWARELRAGAPKNSKAISKKNSKSYEVINEACHSMLEWVYEQSLKVLSKDKIPALAGGDHSVSQGLIKAVGEKYKGDYGLFHLDAHADLRREYEGFKYSHASVMFNVLKLDKAPKKIVQVGIRDFCREEYELIQKEERVECFFDDWIYTEMFKGRPWAELCEEIISKLPERVYVSLDVDVLSRTYAPDTGTPVPGGLSFNQTLYLLAELKRQDKKLIAFDLVETGGGDSEPLPAEEEPSKKKSQKEPAKWDKILSHRLEWNGNVSARLLYYLSGLALDSFNKI